MEQKNEIYLYADVFYKSFQQVQGANYRAFIVFMHLYTNI